LLAVTAGALSAAALTVTGTLATESGKYMIVDEATKARFELQGKGFEKLVSSRVNVTGELVAGENGSTPVILVSSANKVGAAAAAGRAGAGTKMALSTKLLIVGAVGGVAAVGGLAATDAIGGTDAPASRP